jgi:3D (Asp-Asp-Asp) domain-containing protein
MLGGASAASATPRHHGQSPSAVATTVPDPGVEVTIVRDGIDSTFLTHAKTVDEFLAERNITVGSRDELSPAPQTPVAQGMRIDYRAAIPVALFVGREHRDVLTTASDVRSLLADQQVALGAHDRVEPELRESLRAGTVVRVVRESEWTARSHEPISAGVLHRWDPALPPGSVKTAFAGEPGLRELTTRFVQRDDDPLQRQVIAARVVRQPRAKVILHGIGEYAAFARLAQVGFGATLRFASDALRMVATAYTAGCYGCTGVAANGMRAGHGVVAVDPRIIRLGSKLYIPGYGAAIAGDTGGAIRGRRIDLGFNSLGDALRFGRRSITVYVLR